MMNETEKKDLKETEAQAAAGLNGDKVPPAAEGAQNGNAEEAKAADKVPPEGDALKEAQRLAAENYDKFVRLAADMENLRKRNLREREELRQFASAKLLEALLPVLDNLGFGLEAARTAGDGAKAVLDGMAMVAEQLKRVLAEHGLKEINPAGEAFDPNLHEAVSHVPDDKVPADSVIAVTRIGYSLNGRLLRPASVVVSSGKGK